MIIAIASGKGGTGKTTVTTNMAWAVSATEKVVLLDCDVEEPDCHFYIKPEWTAESSVTVKVPSVDAECCDGCGICGEFCRFNALAVIKGGVLVFEELCHDCGGCALACPRGCIEYRDREVGIVRSGSRGGVNLRQGLMNVGEAIAVPVVKAVRETTTGDGLVLVDCPPGTSCPMIQSVKGADYCILVTEPSPFGLHDLDLAHRACNEISVPHGVIISRSTENDRIIEEYCSSEGLTLHGKVPYSREVAEACSRGELLSEHSTEWHDAFLNLFREVVCACQHS